MLKAKEHKFFVRGIWNGRKIRPKTVKAQTVGLAVGKALGFPVCARPERIREKLWKLDNSFDPKSGLLIQGPF